MGYNNTLSYEDSPEDVWQKEVEAANRWNDGLLPGYVKYQMPDGGLGTFNLFATPDLGETFVGRLRLSPERSANGQAGWGRRRLLARLGPGRYVIDVGTPWERVMEWSDEDVACIGTFVEEHTLVFDPDGFVYILRKE